MHAAALHDPEPSTVLRPVGVRPLELWDRPVDGRPLQQWRRERSFARRLATVVQGLRLDAATAVVLTGGDARPELLAALRASGLQASIAADPLYAAARVGRRLVHPCADLCADVGQTSLKLCDGERTWRVERDLARAPLRDTVDASALTRARADTLAFLAATIRERTAPRRVVLGLPAELIDPGWPRACSYAWPDPDPCWANELAAAIGIDRSRLWLVNDAVLAAVAVAREHPRPRASSILVLTLGFGVGAALVEAAP